MKASRQHFKIQFPWWHNFWIMEIFTWEINGHIVSAALTPKVGFGTDTNEMIHCSPLHTILSFSIWICKSYYTTSIVTLSWPVASAMQHIFCVKWECKCSMINENDPLYIYWQIFQEFCGFANNACCCVMLQWWAKSN